MDFSNALVAGIPLVFVVIGLVEWSKRLGVSGKRLLVLSMLVGVALGVLYQYSQQPLEGFSAWFSAAVYGLALGLVASGIYDAARSARKG